MTVKEKMKLQLAISKAETAKLELEYKIEERREDIARMEEHIKLQDEIVRETQEKLNGGNS